MKTDYSSSEYRLTRFKNFQNGTKWMIHSKIINFKTDETSEASVHLQYTILEHL